MGEAQTTFLTTQRCWTLDLGCELFKNSPVFRLLNINSCGENNWFNLVIGTKLRRCKPRSIVPRLNGSICNSDLDKKWFMHLIVCSYASVSEVLETINNLSERQVAILANYSPEWRHPRNYEGLSLTWRWSMRPIRSSADTGYEFNRICGGLNWRHYSLVAKLVRIRSILF